MDDTCTHIYAYIMDTYIYILKSFIDRHDSVLKQYENFSDKLCDVLFFVVATTHMHAGFTFTLHVLL